MLNTLSNFDINNKLSKVKNFLGCYMSDELLPLINTIKFPSYIIINLDDAKNIFSDNSGTHWVCLIIESNKLIYIDSYGVYPDKPTLKFCKNICKKYDINELYYNKKQLQSLYSTSCGWWSVMLIKEHSLGIPIDKLINSFSNNTLQNEQYLQKYFKK
jgi:hypothetical protein